jgi:copper homeostasis protein
MICEICVDSVAGVRAAKDAGAQRVELCADLLEGGVTPSLGAIRQARKVLGIDLNVMIRPRGGDFLFDDDEFAAMRADIEAAKVEGANGVVIGVLTTAGEVDMARTHALVALARPLSVTFHRAFDVAAEPFRALETLIELGVDRVLTSGQEPSVLEGLPLIVELMKRAGDRIVIMPGGGITARNVERIVAAARPPEIHFAALEPVHSAMRFRRAHVFMGGELRPPEYDRLESSAATIGAIVAKASGRR